MWVFDWQSKEFQDLCIDFYRQTLTEEEQKLFRKYDKLPTHKNVLTKMQKVRISVILKYTFNLTFI